MGDCDTPGSPEAIDRGCTCPADLNRDGRGLDVDTSGKPLFVMQADCPLHGLPNHLIKRIHHG